MNAVSKCESCINAKPYGGESDNKCTCWDCEYISRKEAREAVKNIRNIVTCGEPNDNTIKADK